MLSRRMRVGVLAGVMGIGLAAPMAGAEASSMTVKQAIEVAERAFESSPDLKYVAAHAKQLTTKAEIAQALPHFTRLGELYAKVSSSVASSTASTSTEKTARTDWSLGAKQGSQEYAALTAEFHAILSGNDVAAQTKEKQAVAYANKARANVNKADQLLGLPAGV